MRTTIETGEYYWREVLLAGGSSILPVGAHDGVGRADLVVETPDLSRSLSRIAEHAGVCLETVLIAAHARVLIEWCGGVVAVLGLQAQDTQAVLPLRVSTAGRTWRDLLRTTDAAYSDLMHHHSYPVALLRSDLGLPGPTFSSVLRFATTQLEPPLDASLWIDVDPRCADRLHLNHSAQALDAPAVSRIGWDHLRVVAAMTIDLDAAHDAELPQIRLTRPRSAPVAVA